MSNDVTDTTDDATTDSADTAGSVDYRAEADKWKALSRKHEDVSKSTSEKLRKIEADFNSGQIERDELTTRLTELEGSSAQSMSALQRLEVALDNAPEGMSASQVKRLAARLQGSTAEEIAEDARAFFADFVSAPGVRRAPQERLRSGASVDEGDTRTPDQLAEIVLKKARGY